MSLKTRFSKIYRIKIITHNTCFPKLAFLDMAIKGRSKPVG